MQTVENQAGFRVNTEELVRLITQQVLLNLSGSVGNAGCAGCGGSCEGCLLYTSDAADERSSVDLGGRRLIKKKKKRQNGREVGVNKQKTE